jgi:hypothetical protein
VGAGDSNSLLESTRIPADAIAGYARLNGTPVRGSSSPSTCVVHSMIGPFSGQGFWSSSFGCLLSGDSASSGGPPEKFKSHGEKCVT